MPDAVGVLDQTTCAARFLSGDWLDRAAREFAALPVDAGRAVRVGVTVTDAPPDVAAGFVLAVDMASGGLRFDRAADPASGNPHLSLTYRATAMLLLGSARDRVAVFESGDNTATGNFTEVFFLDRVLQQDTGGVLAGLRRRAGGLPADLGEPGWPEPPGEDDGAGPAAERAATEQADGALPATMALLRAELGRSTPGAQLYVSLDGRPVADMALGWARPGVRYTRRARSLWYCLAKPLVSVALGRLWERGLVDPFAPLSRYLPEFTAGGWGRLTPVDLLTHTGPVPTGRDPLHGSLYAPDDRRRELVRALEIPADAEWGSRVNYTQWWAWLLLADVVEAVDGRTYERYATEEILEPCGIAETTSVRLTAAEFARFGDSLPLLHITAADRPWQPTYWFSSAAAATCALPGVNTRGPMADVGRFLEMLVAGGLTPGGRVLAPPTVAALTARHRNGIRDRFGNADWGLGFRLECAHLDPALTSFSRHASPRSYGHEGLWTAVAFADPDAGLTVAAHLNGKTRHEQHRARMTGLCDAIYTDLGLT